ncbi:DUF424 family protein, partial [Candidatus Micrarchaeota archaeon]|nr:DUF424 family protein [Candidatus Micrarchaeota archaeon]
IEYISSLISLQNSHDNIIRNIYLNETNVSVVSVLAQSYNNLFELFEVNSTGTDLAAFSLSNESINITIRNGILSNFTNGSAGYGIIILGHNHSIRNVTITDSYIPFLLGNFGQNVENTVIENSRTENTSYGIAILNGGINNTVKRNRFINSTNASILMNLQTSTYLISDNVFNSFTYLENIGAGTNTLNTSDYAGENIMGGFVMGGNYWGNPDGTGFSDTCTDRGDGICNTNYTLDGTNTDWLPLTTVPLGCVGEHDVFVCGDSPYESCIFNTDLSNEALPFGSCFILWTPDVTIDGNGHIMNGVPHASTFGIRILADNITITNLTVQGYDIGISNGLEADNYYVDGIVVRDCDNSGLTMIGKGGVSNLTVLNTEIYRIGTDTDAWDGRCLDVINDLSARIENVTVHECNTGLDVYQAAYKSLKNFTAYNVTYSGLQIRDSPADINIVENVTIFNYNTSRGVCFFIMNSNNIQVNGERVSCNNIGQAAYITPTENLSILNMNSTGLKNNAWYITGGSSNINVSNFTMTDSNVWGLYCSPEGGGCTNVSIKDVYVANAGSAVYFLGNPSSISIDNISAINLSNAAIQLENGYNISITNITTFNAGGDVTCGQFCENITIHEFNFTGSHINSIYLQGGSINATLENGTISNASWAAIALRDSSHTSIRNISISGASIGIECQAGATCYNAIIRDLSISDTENQGINFIQSSENISISNIEFSNIGKEAVRLQNSLNASIYNVSVSNSYDGLRCLNNCTNLTINDVSVSNAERFGLKMDGLSSSSISNASLGCEIGLDMVSANSSVVTNITINGTSIAGIRLESSSANNLSDIFIYNSSQSAISLSGSPCENNLFEDIYVQNVSNLVYGYAVFLNSGPSNNTFMNLTIVDARGGVLFGENSMGNIFENNTINATTYGIILNSTSNENIIKNNRVYLSGPSSSIIFLISQLGSNIIYNNFFNATQAFVLLNSGGNNLYNTSEYNATNIINGTVVAGNYWAQHDGTGYSQICLDRGDQVCNTSYVMDQNNIDWLPLGGKNVTAQVINHSPSAGVQINSSNVFFNWTGTGYVWPNILCNITTNNSILISNISCAVDNPCNYSGVLENGTYFWNVTCWNGSEVATSPTLNFTVINSSHKKQPSSDGLRCGDGSCRGDENCSNCPEDCGPCPFCGDGNCTADENCTTCPEDCGPCVDVCGDGTCSANEDCITCEEDCGLCPISCFFDQECGAGMCCTNGFCVNCEQKLGCDYDNPVCGNCEMCINNICIVDPDCGKEPSDSGCSYNNPSCGVCESCIENACVELPTSLNLYAPLEVLLGETILINITDIDDDYAQGVRVQVFDPENQTLAYYTDRNGQIEIDADKVGYYSYNIPCANCSFVKTTTTYVYDLDSDASDIVLTIPINVLQPSTMEVQVYSFGIPKQANLSIYDPLKSVRKTPTTSNGSYSTKVYVLGEYSVVVSAPKVRSLSARIDLYPLIAPKALPSEPQICFLLVLIAVAIVIAYTFRDKIIPILFEGKQYFIKIHMQKDKKLIAICDSSIIGKVFKSEGAVLDMKKQKEYFAGELVNGEEVVKELRGAQSAKIIGAKITNLLIDNKMMSWNDVEYVAGIPRATIQIKQNSEE